MTGPNDVWAVVVEANDVVELVGTKPSRREAESYRASSHPTGYIMPYLRYSQLRDVQSGALVYGDGCE